MTKRVDHTDPDRNQIRRFRKTDRASQRGSVNVHRFIRSVFDSNNFDNLEANETVMGPWKNTDGASEVFGIVTSEGSGGTLKIQQSVDGEEVDLETTISITSGTTEVINETIDTRYVEVG